MGTRENEGSEGSGGRKGPFNVSCCEGDQEMGKQVEDGWRFKRFLHILLFGRNDGGREGRKILQEKERVNAVLERAGGYRVRCV